MGTTEGKPGDSQRTMRLVAVGLILLLFLGAGFASLNNMLLYTPDSARYLAWAGSLSKGDGFKDETAPEPTRYVVHAPLYPVLLAPAVALAPGSVIAAKAATLIMGLGVLLLFYAWVRSRVAGWPAVVAVGMLAFNPLTLLYSTQILSDLPFAAAIVAFLWLGGSALPTGHSSSVGSMVALAAAIIAGIFLREVGLTLLVSALFWLLLRKNYREAAILLLAVGGVYLLWYVRNEVIVAGLENPPIRNSRIFFAHVYTPKDAGILTEMVERFSGNIRVYANFFGRLMFYPDFVTRSHSVITASDPLVNLTIRMLPVGQYLLMIVSAGLVLPGFVREIRRPGSGLFVIFVAAYLCLILAYPINDIRFLYPLLIVFIMLSASGIAFYVEGFRHQTAKTRATALVLAALVGVSLIPNFVWAQSFVRNSRAYAGSPEGFFAKESARPGYPETFTRPFDLAGKWIVEHTDSSATILSRWKELAFWLDGRRVIDADPQTAPDVFDRTIRNYRIPYVVSFVSKAGMREHESLFCLSSAYAFESVYRVANVEVVRIIPKRNPVAAVTVSGVHGETREDSTRHAFAAALSMLEDGRAAQAESALVDLRNAVGPYGEIVLHIGIAREFSGRLDEATRTLEQFRYVTQSGSFLQTAWYHIEIISRLKRAARAASPEEKANFLYMVAVNLWEVGFRGESMRMMDRAIQADSSFYPSLAFRAIFTWERGDLSNARKYWRLANACAPLNILSRGLDTVLTLSERLQDARTVRERIAVLQSRSVALATMGLRDDAVGDCFDVLRLDPSNTPAMRLAGDILYEKDAKAPAFQLYRSYEQRAPGDPLIARRLSELESRWR